MCGVRSKDLGFIDDTCQGFKDRRKGFKDRRKGFKDRRKGHEYILAFRKRREEPR